VGGGGWGGPRNHEGVDLWFRAEHETLGEYLQEGIPINGQPAGEAEHDRISSEKLGFWKKSRKRETGFIPETGAVGKSYGTAMEK